MTVRTLTTLSLKEAIYVNQQRREKKENEQLKENNYHDEIGKPSLFYEV
jgi:hypothetical protein